MRKPRAERSGRWRASVLPARTYRRSVRAGLHLCRLDKGGKDIATLITKYQVRDEIFPITFLTPAHHRCRAPHIPPCESHHVVDRTSGSPSPSWLLYAW